PQRPDRAVDHPRRQDRPLGRAALTLEEAAGDLAGRVRALLDIDREREEILPFSRLGATLGGRENHGLAGAHDNSAVGLLRELAEPLRRILLGFLGEGHRTSSCCVAVISDRRARKTRTPGTRSPTG